MMKRTTPLREITAAARTGLSGNWGKAIALLLVLQLLLIGTTISLTSWLFTAPLLTGICTFFINLLHGRARPGNLFDGFGYFGKSLGAHLLMLLFLSFWSLLLIIPGIIKSYSYAMTFFIIAEDPSVGAVEAITRSRNIMNGNKMRLFCLYLRFFGWSILCLFTLGIGYLWLWPYMMASTAAFYEDIKDKR